MQVVIAHRAHLFLGDTSFTVVSHNFFVSPYVCSYWSRRSFPRNDRRRVRFELESFFFFCRSSVPKATSEDYIRYWFYGTPFKRIRTTAKRSKNNVVNNVVLRFRFSSGALGCRRNAGLLRQQLGKSLYFSRSARTVFGASNSWKVYTVWSEIRIRARSIREKTRVALFALAQYGKRL